MESEYITCLEEIRDNLWHVLLKYRRIELRYTHYKKNSYSVLIQIAQNLIGQQKKHINTNKSVSEGKICNPLHVESCVIGWDSQPSYLMGQLSPLMPEDVKTINIHFIFLDYYYYGFHFYA